MAVLFFAEDPGAVNFLVPIYNTLKANLIDCDFLSANAAISCLDSREVKHTPIESLGDGLRVLRSKNYTTLIIGTSENPNSVGLHLNQEAQKNNINTIGVIDFSANAEYRFRGSTSNPLEYITNWLLVADHWTAKAFIELGFDETKILITGHPHFAWLRDKKSTLESRGREIFRTKYFRKAKPKQLILVFASEISTGLNPSQYLRSSEYTLFGNSSSEHRTEIVIEEFLTALDKLEVAGWERPFLVLRKHPKEPEDSLLAYQSQFDFISTSGDIHELLYAADCIVGMSSLVLQEAYLLGRRVLSILPREEEKCWLPLIRQNTIPCATSSEDVKTMMQNLLQHSLCVDSKEFDLTYASDKIINLICGTNKSNLLQVKDGI